MKDFSGATAFKWLWEIEYNLDFLYRYQSGLRESLGFVGCGEAHLQETREKLEAWQERATELANAIAHLQSLIAEEPTE